MPEISFQESGKGSTIIFIHGYPMHSQVWSEFRIALSEEFHVITIDLPGFGQSPLLKIPFSINDVAAEIIQWLSLKEINNCLVVGHSLGGYVALSMVENDPSRFAGLVLFHSTAYPDSGEKKLSRLKVIDFVDRNGVLAFTANFIPPLFASQNHPAIEKIRSIATQSTAEAVKAYALAMKDRTSKINVLKDYKRPILFLAGEQDAGLPVETILEQSNYVYQPEVHILKNVAHMGMFEDPDTLSNVVSTFAKRVFYKF